MAEQRSSPIETIATSAMAAAALARSAGAVATGSAAQERRTEPGAADDGATLVGHDGEPQTRAEARRLARQRGRGRDAARPQEIPAAGWRDIAKRVAAEVKADNVQLIAAGVAFYGLLALFPAMVAAVSIYGLAADPADVPRQLESITAALPAEAGDLLVQQASDIAATSNGALGLSVGIGIATALWSASSGMQWLMTALSVTYDEVEERKFVAKRGTALLLTLGAAVAFVVSVGTIGAIGALARWVGLGSTGELVASIVRWPLLATLVVVGLGVLYRYGPDRDRARWQWVTPGAVVAGVVWLVASMSFAVYTSFAGDMGESYGLVGGIVVVMLWLFLTVFSVLLGAEINAEVERQTARDSTVGRSEPLGERGATVADEVGEPAS